MVSQDRYDPDAVSASAPLTAKDGYLAMYYFVRAYWERGGRRDGSVTLLCNDLGPLADPDKAGGMMTTDPAFWGDWLAAIERARDEGIPKAL
jgi:hypothetical protein